MGYKYLKLISILIIGLYLTTVNGQDVISTSGGDAIGSGGSVSYSVSQLVYTTNTGANGSLAQGVQQPYEISPAIGFEEIKGVTLKYRVYPNPTMNSLQLFVEDSAFENLSFALFNLNGKLLDTKKISSTITTIKLDEFVPSVFLLRVSGDSKEIMTFKIIKN